jgi:hypothetical protein
MADRPTRKALQEALSAAGHAHHEYQVEVLAGVRDEQWAGWYAAYVLGRLGDFTTPIRLTEWLGAAPSADDWPGAAASYVMEQLSP